MIEKLLKYSIEELKAMNDEMLDEVVIFGIRNRNKRKEFDKKQNEMRQSNLKFRKKVEKDLLKYRP